MDGIKSSWEFYHRKSKAEMNPYSGGHIYLVAKRLFDLTMSFVGLMLFSPFLTLFAIIIRLDSPGPVLYKGDRIGLNGKPFKVFKFRTMVANAEEVGGSSTPEDDPRITRIGALLRRYKLDEFPQLLNVLRGEMSFVGPRPQVKWAVDLYSAEERIILNVRPGITDPASLKFSDEGEILKGSRNPDKDYMEKIHPKKMRLGLEYINNRSFLLDLKLIFLTLAKILKA